MSVPKSITSILRNWILIIDLEDLLTPVSHDMRSIPYRSGMVRHELRVFGVRVCSWVKG